MFRPIIIATFLAVLSACGSGSNTSVSPAIAPANPVPNVLTSSSPIELKSGLEYGTGLWADGSTAAGGNGKPIANVNCLKTEDYHIHSHLTILRNEEPLAIPAGIGLNGCAYELHTHDHSGIVHVETSTPSNFTLGQFFAVWGQPLDEANIAGIAGLPIRAYVSDGGAPVLYSGKFTEIELKSRREITIVIGTVPRQIPTFRWNESL